MGFSHGRSRKIARCLAEGKNRIVMWNSQTCRFAMSAHC